MGLRSFSLLQFFLCGRNAAGPAALPESGLGDLPEGCVAAVLLHLDPPQICRLAILNSVFRGASAADCVWGPKLPSNYADFVKRVFQDGDLVLKNSCKRDIYSKLCTPSFIDGGIKKVWMDKATGQACMVISSKGLSMTGVDDRRYWNLIPTKQSMFSIVAYLRQIWWFEVNGEIDFPFPPGDYSLFIRLQLGRPQKIFGRNVCNSEHVHGWDRKPVIFHVSCGEKVSTNQCYLTEKPGQWFNCHAGDFTVGSSCSSVRLEFSMTQTDCTHTKGGLCIDSVVVCPAGSFAV